VKTGRQKMHRVSSDKMLAAFQLLIVGLTLGQKHFGQKNSDKKIQHKKSTKKVGQKNRMKNWTQKHFGHKNNSGKIFSD
jgi:glutamate 5-kinase